MSLKRMLAALVMIVMLFVGLIPSSMAANGITVIYAGGYNEGDEIYVMWYTGIPGADHYDCTIVNQTTGEYVRPQSTSSSGHDASVSGSRVKAGSYKVWVGAIAADGEVLDDGYVYFKISASACKHSWSSRTGTCKLCDAECPHDNGVQQVVTEMRHVSISSTKHKVTKYYDEECKVCRYLLAEDKVKTYEESHKLDSNKDCELCNYRAECSHSNYEYVLNSQACKPIDENKHYHDTWYNKVCANPSCGKVLEYNVDSERDYYTEAHTFDSNSVCTHCEYKKTSEKLTVTINKGQSTAYVGETIYASASASGGRGKYTFYWWVICDGKTVDSETGITSYSHTPTKAGTYKFKVTVRDTSGTQVSKTSGEIIVVNPECVHSDHSYTDKEVRTDSYSKYSSLKHNRNVEYARVCNACGETYQTYVKAVLEDHKFVNGVCACGLSPTPVPGPSVTPCTHSYNLIEISRVITNIGDYDKHAVKIINAKSCTKCGAKFANEEKNTTEPHTLNAKGICTLCGYVRVDAQDDHSDTKNVYTSVYQYYKYDAAQHYKTRTYDVVCKVCGINVRTGVVTKPKYESHTLNASGVCTLCGQDLDDHSDKKVVYTSSYQYQYYDAAQHTKTRTYDEVCNVCGIKIRTGVVTKAKYENHTLDSKGVCTLCGSTVHTHQYQRVVVSSGNIVNFSLSDHKVDVTYYEICACGDKTANKTDTVLEAHDFSNKNQIEALHTASGHHMYDLCRCGAAQYTTYAKYQECCLCMGHNWGPAYQNGNKWFQNCTRCGATQEVNAPVCLHQGTKTEVLAAENYTYVDENWHSKTVENDVVCDLCGVSVGTNKTAPVNEKHTMSNGKCDKCGYSIYDWMIYVQTLTAQGCDGFVVESGKSYSIRLFNKVSRQSVSPSLVQGAKVTVSNIEGGGIYNVVSHYNTLEVQNAGKCNLNLYINGVNVASVPVFTLNMKNDTWGLLSFQDADKSFNMLNCVDDNLASTFDWKHKAWPIRMDTALDNYKSVKNKNGSYTVTFDIYNGATDLMGLVVYDRNGNEVAYRLIEAYTYEVGIVHEVKENLSSEGLELLFTNGNLTNQSMKKTTITVTVPDGGYINFVQMKDDERIVQANWLQVVAGVVRTVVETGGALSGGVELIGKKETEEVIIKIYGKTIVKWIIEEGITSIDDITEYVRQLMNSEEWTKVAEDIIASGTESVLENLAGVAIDYFVPAYSIAMDGINAAFDGITSGKLIARINDCEKQSNLVTNTIFYNNSASYEQRLLDGSIELWICTKCKTQHMNGNVCECGAWRCPKCGEVKGSSQKTCSKDGASKPKN